MQKRMQSLHKTLMYRLLALAIVLSLVVGGSVFFRERQTLEDSIAERTRIAIELLRLRVVDITKISDQPWQTLVQTALDDLKDVAPRSALGRFAWVSIRNAEGHEIAALRDLDTENLPQLITTVDQQAMTIEDIPLVEPLSKIDGRPSFAIGIRVADETGATLATLRGIYVISSDVMDDLWRSIARSVGASILIVILVTALHYPVIRRLLDSLGHLSIHLLDANLETLQGFGSAIAKRDSDTDAHNFRVTIYAVRLAEAVNLDANGIRTLIKGAFLHDVGKIGIRDHILLKQGRLEPDEFEIMKTHVKHGLDIVNNCHWLQDASEVVGNHHEKFDGSGYYTGLKGHDIPVNARIFAIVDVFDALTSERPYKQPLSLDESMAIIRTGAGQHFDPELVDKFETLVDSLYEKFAANEVGARKELAHIIDRYFKGDIGDLIMP